MSVAAWKAGDSAVRLGEWRTTIGAELERPAKFCSISLRASTDSEPFACQPAPDSAVSTLGAKIASTTATTPQVSETSRR